MRHLQITAALLTIALGASAFQQAMAARPDKDLTQAVAGSWRSPANVMRDGARHPADELAFFDIKPTMTVVEVWPSGGYWTEILAPYLHDHGIYYAAGLPKALGDRAAKAEETFQAKLDAQLKDLSDWRETTIGADFPVGE